MLVLRKELVVYGRVRKIYGSRIAARNNHAFSLRGVRRYSRAVILRGGRAAEAIDLAVASVAAAAALYCSACLQQVLNQWIYLANLLV